MSDKNDTKIALISLFNLDFGVRHISSFLKGNGYLTYIIFFNKQRYSVEFLGNDYFSPRLMNHNICHQKDLDLLISLLKKLKVTIVGISVSSVTMQAARMITLGIKKHLNVIVVWGGVHAIIAPEECIQYADIVCTGEGELPMVELAEKVKHNKPISGIKNLWIKRTNCIEKNEARCLIEDLDKLPFADFIDRDNKLLIDNGKLGKNPPIISSSQQGIYPIMTSRGCLYSCSFCCNSILRQRFRGKGKYLRRRSVENVIAELKCAVKNRYFHTIRFWDDVFTFDAQWIDKFCFHYVREIGKPFACYAHPKNTDRNILVKLRHAGLVLVDVGIQSGSEEVSKEFFSRAQSNQDFINFSYFMKKLGITARYDLISDNPYETDYDQNKTVELLLKLLFPFQIQLYSLCWFPGTPLTEKALADGVISKRDLEQCTSKALNNFHMYIPLSRSKRDFFWNCIKAMAVNRYFPKFWVRFCKKNIFFRKYPKVLFLLALNYLRLFTNFRLKLRDSKIVIVKMFPRNSAKYVDYLDGNRIRQLYIFEHAKWLFREPEIEYNFFLEKNTGVSKRFCLRIRQWRGRSKFFRIIMNITPFELEDENPPPRLLWLMEFFVTFRYQNDIHFDLSYPELFYLNDGYKRKAKLLKDKLPPFLNKRMYLAQLQNADNDNESIGRVLFKM